MDVYKFVQFKCVIYCISTYINKSVKTSWSHEYISIPSWKLWKSTVKMRPSETSLP